MFARLSVLLGLALAVAGCATLPKVGEASEGIPTFASEAQIDAYVAAQWREHEGVMRREAASGYEEPILVTGSRIESVAITNVQEEGVDEGGIVKATSEYLIVLRRGRIVVMRHTGATLDVVSAIDAFPPGDPAPNDTWYDEMLLDRGMVVVVGYSYGGDATEISRFRLAEDGTISYRDTHYLSSDDYFSSRNYASRLIGGRFVTYTPSPFEKDWRKSAPFLERRNPDGSRTRVGPLLKPANLGVAAGMVEDVPPYARDLHGVTQCDLLAEELTCSTRGVIGSQTAEYYFSREAAYVWTEVGHDERFGRAKKPWASMLYRIPLDEAEPMTAIAVQGAPIDQFSFHEDGERQSLFVMTKGRFNFGPNAPFAATMWESETRADRLALFRMPLDHFGNGAQMAPALTYRPLAEIEAWGIQNRFVGNHLLYGGGGYYEGEDDMPGLMVSPLDADWVQRIDLPHGISRIDRLGNDAIVIGEGNEESLGFSAIRFSQERWVGRLDSTYLLPDASEGESRSHAFFWQPDPGDPLSGDGIMALPIEREPGEDMPSYLGSGSGVFFLRRKQGVLEAAGELSVNPADNPAAVAAAMAADKLSEDDACDASCVDWYGNARPIFLGERLYALVGDELIEGRLVNGQVVEQRRITFWPGRAATAQATGGEGTTAH